MNKHEFLKKALQAEEYRRKAWVLSAFALVMEETDEYLTDPYAYRIVRQPNGVFFVDPEAEFSLTKIDNAKLDEPLFTMREKISLAVGDIPNLSKPIESTVGNLLVNWMICVYPFGKKIPYQEGKIKARGMEALILEKLTDNPPEDTPKEKLEDPNTIYVFEYLKFCDAMFWLPGILQLCAPSATPKTMTSDPRIPEIKAKLLEENKDRLHDPAVIAKIDAQLVDIDKNQWMKDDPGADFYAVSGKAYNMVRRKAFSMMGAESGLEDKVEMDLIQNSLEEGWDISKFPSMNNNLRAGSFNRGALTMLGGESTKWLLRASANMRVVMDDCGTKFGIPEIITEENHKKMVGFSLITPNGLVKVTKENSQSFIDKSVVVRSPMTCKLEKTDFCATCVGERLANNPTGLSAAVADYGSTFLYIFMSAVHGKALLLAKMDYRKSIT